MLIEIKKICKENNYNYNDITILCNSKKSVSLVAEYLSDNDIVYVNSKGTTRWNRVISQFFPFSSFLNSVDNLVNSD